MTAWSQWGVTSHAGPCGQSHAREDATPPNVPAQYFMLECETCERDLFGLDKPDIIERTPGDPLRGIKPQQKIVKPVNPMWGKTMASCPIPDWEAEAMQDTAQNGRGHFRIEALERMGALKMSGMNIPPELAYLTESRMPSGR